MLTLVVGPLGNISIGIALMHAVVKTVVCEHLHCASFLHSSEKLHTLAPVLPFMLSVPRVTLSHNCYMNCRINSIFMQL